MTSNYHTPFPFNFALTSAAFNQRLGELDSALYNFVTGAAAVTQLNFGNGLLPGSSYLTISGGVITVSKTYHIIDVESGSSDDLDTINGTTGDDLYLTIASSARPITIKHNTGNIYLANGKDITLNDSNKPLHLFRTASYWTDIGGVSYIGVEQIIQARTVPGTTTGIAITNIPSTFNHLRILAELRMGSGTASIDVLLSSDSTAANYRSIESRISVGGFAISENIGATAGVRIPITPSTGPAGHYTPLTLDIFNYASTTLSRMIRWESHVHRTALASGADVAQGGGTWMNTSQAVSRIDINPVAGAALDASICAYTVYGRL